MSKAPTSSADQDTARADAAVEDYGPVADPIDGGRGNDIAHAVAHLKAWLRREGGMMADRVSTADREKLNP